MQITLILNPRSGRGKAVRVADELSALLVERGHHLERFEMNAPKELLEERIASSDRVLVLGGDGTVHHLLPLLVNSDTPMYHFGSGTANLIAKEFGMSREIQTVISHLESEFQPTRVDVPTCNGVPFLIMVSMGIDASVIHRLEESRKRKGGYRAYLLPVSHEVFAARPARFTVQDLDSTRPPYQGRGILVVSNLKSYGGGFNPNLNAKFDDGLLDLVAIKCRSSLGAAVQYAYLLLRRSSRSMYRMKSSSLVISSADSSACVQVDGEKATRFDGLSDGCLQPKSELRIQRGNLSMWMHSPLNGVRVPEE